MRKKIINCLNHELVNLYKQTAKLQALEEQIKTYLPDHLQSDINISSFEKGILTIACRNPAISTELRFMLPSLRESLRQKAALYTLRSIKLVNQL